MFVVDVAVKMGLGAKPLSTPRTLTHVGSVVVSLMVTMAELAQNWLTTLHFLRGAYFNLWGWSNF